MQKLDYAPLSVYRLGACSRCLNSAGLVDIDVMIEFDGNVALCSGCIADAALMAGYFLTEAGAERLDAAEKRAEAAEARAAEAEKLLSTLQSTVTRVRNLKGGAK